MKTWVWLFAALGCLCLLYLLPRAKSSNTEASPDESVSSAAAHDFSTLYLTQKARIDAWRSQLQHETLSAQAIRLYLDSIASRFVQVGMLDSCLVYADRLHELGDKKRAARLYYRVQKQWNSARGGVYAYDKKLRTLLNELTDKYPNEMEWQIKKALTMLNSSNPMEGVNTMKRLLKENPHSRELLFQMGKLSTLSGQYDKALDYFDRLLKQDPADGQAMLYVSEVWIKKGNPKKASFWLKKIEDQETDPVLLSLSKDMMRTVQKM